MFYSILLIINYLNGFYAHDFHVSVCQIEFDQKSKALEISHRIFLDDLEETLKFWSNDPGIDVLEPVNQHEFQEMLGEYILEKFNVLANGKSRELNYLGSEIEDDVMYCYVEIPGIKKLKSIEVTNTILMDLYTDQVNIIHIIHNNETKSLKLDRNQRTDLLTY